MIYVTLTTRNRFWHCALTALSLAQGTYKGCFVHVLDDASDDAFADAKQHLFDNLKRQDKINRFERLSERIGFCGGRELLVRRFFQQPQFTHWFHLDDDILLGPETVHRAVRDLNGPLAGKGILHVYANPWCDWKKAEGGFAKVRKIGGACYVITKHVLEKIGNPYTGQSDGEAANAAFWRHLARVGEPMHIRWKNPYLCQHTGNVESTIFGYTPTWESLYAKDFRTGNIVEVPPFQTAELRKAIKSRNLSGYVWRMNSACRVQVKLPAPGSETGISPR